MLFACLILLAGSCKRASFINPHGDKIILPINGGSQALVVEADGSYSVDDCPGWLDYSIVDNTLAFTAKPNDTGSKRECVVKLTAGDIVKQITIIQADKCTHINADTQVLNFEKEGGTKTVNIETDGGDINVTPAEGVNAIYDNGKLTVTVPSNDGKSGRKEIKLTCDNITTSIYVTQQGKICPRCGGAGTIKCPKCGGAGWYGDEIDYLYFDIGCTRCGGSGMAHDYGETIKKGSGRITCPECGGSGV